MEKHTDIRGIYETKMVDDFFRPYAGITMNEDLKFTLKSDLQTRYLDGEKAKIIATDEVLFGSDSAVPLKIGIIGAGMSGLYTAYMMTKKYKGLFPKMEIEILEAARRVGGRVHTHYFNGQPNQYAELGAMRIPSAHAPVLDLINDLKLQTLEFHLSNENGRVYFNKTKDGDKIMTSKYATENPGNLGFGDKDFINNVNKRLDLDGDLLRKYTKYFKVNGTYEKGIDKLKKYDEKHKHSVRQFLIENDFTTEQILYIESYLLTTEAIDKSFVEYIIDRVTFEYGENKWHTIEGGMQKLPETLAENLLQYIKFGCSVYKIAEKKNEKNETKIKVYYSNVFSNEKKYAKYDHVIVTAPFGVVRNWDLPDSVSKKKLTAIRALSYDHSSKLFLQFRHRFWEKLNCPILGGCSSTDLPIRTVVYPSHGIRESNQKGVLLASYTWGQDAVRWVGMSEADVLNTAIRNLQTIHPNDELKARDLMDYALICWDKNPYSLGAFANFTPGQLSEYLVSSKCAELGGRLHFAGEHVSIYHAWIIGAMDSAIKVIGEIHQAVKNTVEFEKFVNFCRDINSNEFENSKKP